MTILAELASDDVLDTAHEWLCRRRRDYPWQRSQIASSTFVRLAHLKIKELGKTTPEGKPKATTERTLEEISLLFDKYYRAQSVPRDYAILSHSNCFALTGQRE